MWILINQNYYTAFLDGYAESGKNCNYFANELNGTHLEIAKKRPESFDQRKNDYRIIIMTMITIIIVTMIQVLQESAGAAAAAAAVLAFLIM